MRKLILTSLITILSAATITTVSAAEPTPAGCQPIYNGGNVCSNNNVITVNKKVLNPSVKVNPGQKFQDSDFIENIGPNDTRYGPNQLSAFRIYVTNKSRSTQKNITVKDIFPPRFITFVSGNGNYDASSRTFSTTIAEMKANETKAITIQVMTARQNELPTDNNSLCTINLALATVGSKTSQDTAQICVSNQANGLTNNSATSIGRITPSQTTKGGLAVSPKPIVTPNQTTTKGGLAVASPATPQAGQNTPSTGPEALVLSGLVPTGFFGWLLRKKTS